MKKTCKSIFRRTLSFVVTAAMCLSLLPGAVFAGDETGVVPEGTAENSIVQVDTTMEEQTKDSEEVTEPDADVPTEEGEGEAKEEVKTEEPNPDEGEDEDKGETQQPNPAEDEGNNDLGEGGDDTAEPGEGEGKEDSEDKTDSKEDSSDPSKDEEKEEAAEHVHNEDGWSCVWSECIHEHGPECYVPGEDGEEDVLDCAHVCGEECLANTEGFWICTEPETPVYATVEELEAAFEAVGEALESGDVQAGIDALDAYLDVYNRLSPEDQEENAEAFAAAMAYQETLKGSLEGIPDPDIETLKLTTGHKFQVKVAKVYLGTSGNIETTYKQVTCTYSSGHSSGNCQTPLKEFYPTNFGWGDGADWLGYRKDQYGTWTKNSSYNGRFYSWKNDTIMLTCTSGGDRAWDTIYLVYKDPVPEYTVTVKYVYENGTTAATSQSKTGTSGTSYSITSPSISGYTPDKDVVSGTISKDETITVTYKKNGQYYAHVIYNSNANGDSVSNMPSEYKYVGTDANPSYTPRGTPTRQGYTFQGWSTTSGENNEGGKVTGSVVLSTSTTADGPITRFYAIWKKNNPAISVSKEVVGNGNVNPGDEVKFKITVTNTGNVDFKVVAVSDVLPEGLTFEDATGNPMTTKPYIVWVLQNVAAGKINEFTVTATVDSNATGTLTNKVTVMGQTSDGIQVKDDDTASVTVGGTDPGTKKGNFTVEKSFADLDAGVTLPAVTLSYEAWRTKDGKIVDEKESGNVILTLNGDKYTGTITPTVWNIPTGGEGNLSESERLRYKNVVIITEDLNSAKVNGYTWKSFSTFYIADGTKVGDNSVSFTMDGATFEKTLSVKNTYTKDVVNPKLTGITKEPAGATVNGKTADINNLSVKKGDVVVLRYQITVKGEKNAKYIVTDDDVTVVSGSLEGTIGDSGEAVIIVTKTVTATEAGTLKVTNTAYVKPGDDTDPVDPKDPDKGHPSDEVETDISVSPALGSISKKLDEKAEKPESVKVGDEVTLHYIITVTGDEGAKYTVTDENATLEKGSLWSGTLDSSMKAEIYVSKTVQVKESDIKDGKFIVTNTAYVKPGEGTDPVDPTDDPEEGHPSNEVETKIPVKNPKLTGITKKLVSPEGTVTVKRGESVELVYEITVTGEKGAKYEVSDPEASDTTWKGIIDESGKAVITVTKTFTPTEEQKGTVTVKNTAYVKPNGEGTDPIKPEDPDKDPTDPEKGYPSNEVETEITIIEPNPKLKSIVKKLVTPEPITVRVGENVTLEYTITITGDEGAEYKVTDDGAELKDGSSWDGKLGESGEAVITVTKTVTPTEAGTMTVENTAFVKPGEGTDPIKPVDPENPDEPVEPEPSNKVTTDITVTDGREITITWLRNYSRDDETIIKRDQRVPANITSDEIGARYPGEDQIPNREGYEFIGWGERVTDELGNITIRAQWRYVGPSGPTTPTGPTDPTPGDSDTDDDSDPDPDPDPTPVRRVTVNVPDAPTPLAEIGENPVPLASNPSDLIDIFDDDVPLAGGAQTGNNDALWYLLAALSLAGLGLVKLLDKKSKTK